MSKSEKSISNRYRNWSCVLYPESMGKLEDAIDYIESLCVPSFLSPLHDKDVEKSGELKKAHYHFMVMFAGKKSLEQISELFAPLGYTGRPQFVNDSIAYARYLCHLDSANKANYSIAEVKSFGGVDYSEYILKSSDLREIFNNVIKFSQDNHIIYYHELVDLLIQQDEDQMLDAVTKRFTYAITSYFKSLDTHLRRLED